MSDYYLSNNNFPVTSPLLFIIFLVISSNALATESDDFELYAKIHLSIDMADDDQEESVSLSNNSSRFGFQGKHPINNETAFLWRMEQKVYMDESGGRFGSTCLKGQSLDKVTDKQVLEIQTRLNQRPRKLLGFETPEEVYTEMALAA